MIAWIAGQIKLINETSLVLNINNDTSYGIGYEVFVTPRVISSCQIGEVKEFYIYSLIREDIFKLFGFSSLKEKYLFEKMISISGVGAKAAMAILQIAPINDIIEAILMGDANFLIEAKGVGKKMAGRVIQELKDISFGVGMGNITNGKSDNNYQDNKVNDAIAALVSLGYDPVMARRKISQTIEYYKINNDHDKEELSTEELIKIVLKNK